MKQKRKWLKSEESLRFAVADRVATITLARPDKRNALSKGLIEEIHQALLEADDLSEVHAIILEGEGTDFCAGYDLSGSYGGGAEAAGPAWDATQYRTRNATIDDDCWHLERQQALMGVMFDLHKPVICKIQGNCLAGGTDLAFACDIVIAAADAKIGFPAARANGTPPTNFWIYHCGPQWAKRMLFTGDTILGVDAARIGLVLDAYPPAELDAAVAELAHRISRVDSEMLASHKRMVNLQMELMGAKTALRLGAELDARAHLAEGPLRTRFRQDVKEIGLKEAVKNRDAPFGNSRIELRSR